MSGIMPWAGSDSGTRVSDVTDGTSHTFLLGEISQNDPGIYRTWLRGCDGWSCASAKNIQHSINHYRYTQLAVKFNDISFGSEHPGGSQFVFADGSTRFINADVDLVLYLATASIDGGEAGVVR